MSEELPGFGTGVKVGGYEIQGVLGQGGMGIVYRAYHEKLDRIAAIKVLPPFVTDAQAQARFQREAQAIAQLRHPNILNVYDFGELGGRPYMIIEYMANGALSDHLLPQDPVPTEKAINLLRPLAEGIDYAHSMKVIHRDIKPQNVFLDANLNPVLADFGLVKLYEKESMTMSGSVTGTPYYMAPEQAQGRPVSTATDRYSFAVMAFQLLAGRVPYEGEGWMDVIMSHCTKPVPSLISMNPHLNPGLDNVFKKAMAKEPEDRYPTCKEFVDEIEKAVMGKINLPFVPSVPDPQKEESLPPGLPASSVGSNPLSESENASSKLYAYAKQAMSMPGVVPAMETPQHILTPPAHIVRAIPKEKRKNRKWEVIIVFVMILMLASVGFAYNWYRQQQPIVASSKNWVVPGGKLLITGKHLPGRQAINVVLDSDTYHPLSTGQSDAEGSFSQVIDLPRNTTLKEHTVALCWQQIQCTSTLKITVLREAPIQPTSQPSK